MSAWTTETAYELNDEATPVTPNGLYYIATTAGTSDADEPTWPTTVGETVADGTVVWTCAVRDLVPSRDGAPSLGRSDARWLDIFIAPSGAFKTGEDTITVAALVAAIASGAGAHNSMTNRDATGAHPMSAITDLVTTLGNKEPADETILKQANIVNNLTTTTTTVPLSAAQGKALKDLIDGLSGGGASFVGGIDASGAATQFDDAAVGNWWKVTVAGTILGTELAVGDAVWCTAAVTGTPADFTSFIKIDNTEDPTNLHTADVRNNLTSTDTDKPLSAAQGKALSDTIDGLGSVYAPIANVQAVDRSSSSGTLTLVKTDAIVRTVFTENAAIALTLAEGETARIDLIAVNDAAGSYVISFPAGTLFDGGTRPTEDQTASKINHWVITGYHTAATGATVLQVGLAASALATV